ncbi:MAG: hypothetical protein NVSMB57_05710 [Actinomycetota bacterium]
MALALVATQLFSAGLTNPARASNTDSIVVTWNEAILQGVRDAGGQFAANKLGPPMTARAIAIVNTCMYDAWAAYDEKAIGTRLGATLRRPVVERTDSNKSEAMSFAAYRALADLMPIDIGLYRHTMTSLGYDFTNTTVDTTTAAGVGNVACAAVLSYRHHDGSNQLGDLHAPAYSDYTGYVPVNKPMEADKPIDVSTVVDPNRWQPLTYFDQLGKRVTPKAIGTFWNKVAPFGLKSAGQFRSAAGAAKYGTAAYVKQALDLVTMQASLTDEQKSIAEYFADGPNSELPPGHWVLFAIFVSRRDHHSLDQDIKMFFALTNAIFDAGIVAWDDKGVFDSVRPITAIRYLFNGVLIPGWAGPGKGVQLIDGGTWTPYQAPWFPTPPFAEYASGPSNFSAAGAETLTLFTGSSTLGASFTIRAGTSKFEPGITPATDITLSWPTFQDAANQAGISRRYGGIHFEQGDIDGRRTGKAVADWDWAKSQAYFNGTVTQAASTVTAGTTVVNQDPVRATTLSAHLRDASGPLPGRRVVFSVGDTTVLCAASITDDNGVATCGATPEQLQSATNLGFTAAFGGDGTHQGSWSHGNLVRVSSFDPV